MSMVFLLLHNYAQAAALSEDAMAQERRGRKGRKSTQVAGILGKESENSVMKPTLLG